MARMIVSRRDVLTACIYAGVVVLLVGGAFFGVQVMLPAHDNVSSPEIDAPFKKIQAGAPRELPPIEEGKAEKPVYVPSPIRRSEIHREAESQPLPAVQRPPERPELPSEVQATAPPPRPRFVPPDVHDR